MEIALWLQRPMIHQQVVDEHAAERRPADVVAEGRVFTWGKGDDGTLGTGEPGSSLRPRLVEALLRHPISEVPLAHRRSAPSVPPPALHPLPSLSRWRVEAPTSSR